MKFNQQEYYPYDITEDVNLIKEVFSMDNFELSHEADVPYTDILKLNNTNPDREVVDKIYDYAYDRGLYLNDIKWLEYKDELSDTNLKLLSHGSREGIRGIIRVDVSNRASDFGSGFYCGESLKQAGMFVSDAPNGCIYILSFDKSGLKPIKFNISNDWMLAVAYYRETLSDEYKQSGAVQRVIESIESADYVIAPIADNRIFETIDMFVNKELTDTQCRYALSAIHLGNQYVFKTQRCVDNLEILSRCYMCPIERASFAHDNSIETNTSRYKADIAKQRFADKGQYIDELLSE